MARILHYPSFSISRSALCGARGGGGHTGIRSTAIPSVPQADDEGQAFYVDNLLGDLDATVAVASPKQAACTRRAQCSSCCRRRMVKQKPGFNPRRRIGSSSSWMFRRKARKSTSAASPTSTTASAAIVSAVTSRPSRNSTSSVNRTRLCANPRDAPHVRRPAEDRSRCQPPEELTEDDKKSLAELSEIVKAIMEKSKTDK